VRHGQRLVGVELHAERPGEAAAFYAWMLGPGSGGEPTSWQPASLLFEHAVCGIHAVEPSGPPASWVPVVAVHGLDAARERAEAEGMRCVDRQGRSYLVDNHDLWTRLVDSERIPMGIDPDAVGNTIAEINVPDPADTLAAYARVLDLERVEMLDDIADFHMLLDGGVLALGGLWYDSQLVRPVGAAWMVYFDVPDLELTVQRALGVGVQVAAPPTREDYNIHTVLIDPFGLPFGFCTYYDLEQSQMRVRREDGEELLFKDAVRLLNDPRE
jgi:predicted enzyme related to lactoylglutathione lyase